MIEVNSLDKSTTIRLKENTKRKLEYFSKGKETHEEIILRLMKLVEMLSSDSKTELVHSKVIGTKYVRLHKTLHIKLDGIQYVVVCNYNDLSPILLFRQNSSLGNFEWLLDLEIVNVNKGAGWKEPKKFPEKEQNTLYLISLKQILEETFDVILYQFSNLSDYFNVDNWIDAYKKNNLSKESLQKDVKRKLV